MRKRQGKRKDDNGRSRYLFKQSQEEKIESESKKGESQRDQEEKSEGREMNLKSARSKEGEIDAAQT